MANITITMVIQLIKQNLTAPWIGIPSLDTFATVQIALFVMDPMDWVLPSRRT